MFHFKIFYTFPPSTLMSTIHFSITVVSLLGHAVGVVLLFDAVRLFAHSELQPTGDVIIGVWTLDGVSVVSAFCPSEFSTSALTVNSGSDSTGFGVSSTVVDWLSEITVTSGASTVSLVGVVENVSLELAFSLSLLSFLLSLSQNSSLLTRPHLLLFCQFSLMAENLKD